MENNKNNKDKKKLLIMLLFLFTIIGLTGYGVYSYYYTTGSFDTVSAQDNPDADNVIRITGSFNPTYYGGSAASGSSGSGGSFLGNGGSIPLECPETTNGNETIYCTATVTVRNEGSTGINVRYYDGSASASRSDGGDVDTGSLSLSWSNSYESSIYISNGSSETLNLSVPVYTNGNGSSSNTPEEVSEPVSSSTLTAYASFYLDASQYTDY